MWGWPGTALRASIMNRSLKVRGRESRSEIKERSRVRAASIEFGRIFNWICSISQVVRLQHAAVIGERINNVIAELQLQQKSVVALIM